MNVKLSTAAAALLMATALPAFAQEAIEIPDDVVIPEEHILLQFTDMGEDFFLVSYEDAADICGITDEQFEEIAEDPATAIIYCEELSDVAVRETFMEEGRIVSLNDFENDDPLAAEGVDAEGDEADDDLADDDVTDDVADDDVTDDDVAEDDVAEDDMTEDDMTEDGEADAETETEVDAEVEAEAEASVDADSGDDADAGDDATE